MKYAAKHSAKHMESSKPVCRHLPSFVFILFIFGFAIWFLINPKADYSSSEKRYLQKFPTVSVNSVLDGKFGTDFEKYFADHFPMRTQWVGANAYFNLSVGNNGADGVYNCKNGYLINKPILDTDTLESNVQTIADFAKSVDVPVTVTLVPSTGYIANDVLPAVHDTYTDDEKIENAQKVLTESGADFVDLRSAFKNAYANGTQLYYKTDHHWTTAGAYTGYTEICKSLGITHADKSLFTVEKYNDFYGTTYSTSGFWLTQPDTIEIWNNKNNTEKNISVEIIEGDEKQDYHSMYFYNHLKEDDKYPVFIDGNHAMTRIKNTNAAGGKIILVKDSFSHCLAPFLAENYSEVILVDMRYYKNSISELAQQEKPDNILVLYGIDNLATDTDIAWLS